MALQVHCRVLQTGRLPTVDKASTIPKDLCVLRRFPPSVAGVIGAFVLIAALGTAVSYFSIRLAPSNTWRFVEQVLLEREYGDRERVIVRWTRPVTIGIRGATDEDKRILHDLVRETNEVLQHTGVSLEIGEFAKSDIGVIFAPHRDFPTIADRLGFDYVEGNLGFFFWVYPDDRYEIGSAAVLIAQELTGDARKYAIMQEVIQALGPTNDSPLYPE